MKKLFAFVCVCLLTVAFSGVALAQEPNAGTRVEFSAAYDINGRSDDQATIVGVRVALTNRWSAQFVNAFAPTLGNGGITIHLAEGVYERNLGDFLRARSVQTNPSRFVVGVFGGAGAARNAAGAGNASFAVSAGGRLTVRLNDTTSVDLFEYRYIRSRIVTASFQRNDTQQVAPGIRIRF